MQHALASPLTQMGLSVVFFEIGNGHCVTPYAVAGDTIRIYDNNEPLDPERQILIEDGEYRYPERSGSPNQGHAIAAFPISIWEEGRHLFGFREFNNLIDGDVVEFLISIAVGSAEMEVVTENGSLGFLSNGDRVDHVAGGMMLPLMGPSDTEMRQIPALLAMNQTAPLIRIHAKGSSYTYHTGAQGHFLQLASNSGESGSRDDIQLRYEQQALTGMTFNPWCGCQQCGSPSRSGHHGRRKCSVPLVGLSHSVPSKALALVLTKKPYPFSTLMTQGIRRHTWSRLIALLVTTPD